MVGIILFCNVSHTYVIEAFSTKSNDCFASDPIGAVAVAVAVAAEE
jgi:hypothetical protein